MEQLVEQSMEQDTDEIKTDDSTDIEELVENNIVEILDNSGVSESDQRKIIREIRSYYSGPLPPPEVLKQYTEIPGVLDLILKMADEEMSYRHEINAKIVNSEVELNSGQVEYVKANIKIKTRLQWFGFFVTTVLLIAFLYCLFTNRGVGGLITFIGALSGFFWTVFYGKKNGGQVENNENKNRDEKNDEG